MRTRYRVWSTRCFWVCFPRLCCFRASSWRFLLSLGVCACACVLRRLVCPRAERSSDGSPPSLRCLCHPRHFGSSQLHTRALFLRPQFTPYAVVRMSGFTVFSGDAKAAASQLDPLWKQSCASAMSTRISSQRSIATASSLRRCSSRSTGQWKALPRYSKKRLGWVQAKAVPTNANLLSSSQHGRKARFSLRRRTELMLSHGRSVEEVRKKYSVVTHLWLLAKMLQPSRPMYAELDEKCGITFWKS